jgi:hypothetical protein
LAHLAFAQDRFDQAATLFSQVLRQAELADDAMAISDAGYNLSVVELRRGDALAARQQAALTREMLERRGAPVAADLLLVEAVASYRLGDAAAALALADEAATAGADQPSVTARAAFVRGLVAADRGDTASAEAALARMAARSGHAAHDADQEELAGRLALLRGETAAARTAFVAAADRRRELRDYRGMARALALAGSAAASAGDQAAAGDLWLRAGRSAALQGDVAAARGWLELAAGHAAMANPGLAAQARALLRSLPLSAPLAPATTSDQRAFPE